MKTLAEVLGWLWDAPTGTQVDARVLASLLGDVVDGEGEAVGDLTLPQVADRICRSVSTVRGWCASGDLVAYKLQGREWRVKPSDLRAFLDAQTKPTAPAIRPPKSGPVDLGTWRKVPGRGAS